MDAFRAHPLDGAVLFFQPSTGIHLRLENDATRALRQEAPRVVMFGITNACNLRCAYCSRDADRASQWSVSTAADVLADLADAGTLEVAFGGGEPFAFRGFGELLVELRRRTPLALHVTTNGALLDEAILARGILGEVRLSLHDGTPWRTAGRRLLASGQRWGANVLVTPRVVEELPALLTELAALGARDVALLSYVGADAGRHLGSGEEARLAAVIHASPLPCRVSVCFGRRLDVPRLLDAGCGAGRDFLTLGPDRRLQSCSFQDTSAPAETASAVLALWRAERAWLARRSPRSGCGRDAPGSTTAEDRAGLRVWQAFSGNNSGECVLVAKLATVEDAQRLLDEVAPGFEPGEPYSAAWQQLFAREEVGCGAGAGRMPDEIATIGKSFVAYTDSALEDDFPDLRALAWKRGVFVVPGAVQGQAGPQLLAVVRGRDHLDAEAIAAQARAEGATAITHGAHAIVAGSPAPVHDAPDGQLAPLGRWLAALAADRPCSAELHARPLSAEDLAAATRALGASPARRSRLVATFRDAGSRDPGDYAHTVERAVRVGEIVLVEDVVRSKRPAIRGLRMGADVADLEVDEVEVSASIGIPRVPRRGRPEPDPPPLEARELADALRARLRRTLGDVPLAPLSCTGSRTFTVGMRTTAPAAVLAAILAETKAFGRVARLRVGDPDPLGRALRRLLDDVRPRRRR